MRHPRTTADRGATSVEYGLVVSLIAMAVTSAVVTLGTGVTASFDRACAALSAGTACQDGAAPGGDRNGNRGANGNHGTGNRGANGNHGTGNRGANGNHGTGNNGNGGR